MPVSRALWETLGFRDADDFDVLDRAKTCARCGETLHPTARYRLRNADGTWSDDVVCPSCLHAVVNRLGYAPDGHQAAATETLF